MHIWLSLLISVIGLILYYAGKDKHSTVGLHAFWVGLLAFLLLFGGTVSVSVNGK